MKLTLGFSPCPNDTFIFDALIHHKIDTEGLAFEAVLNDVEELNQKALQNTLDITKLSYHAYAYLSEQYVLLSAGSALGNNCGPLLIAKENFETSSIHTAKIAIPGKYTTANLLLNLAYPQAQNKEETLFSEIEQKILNNQVDAGLIIHENRFTYRDKGLSKVLDLGEYWENKMRVPIPLGGIAVRRSLNDTLKTTLNRILRRSVEYALAHPNASLEYTRQHAQEMSIAVIQQHIQLYVNQYSVNLGAIGKRAVHTLYELGEQKQILPKLTYPLFIG